MAAGSGPPGTVKVPSYPAVAFLVRHGNAVSVGLGFLGPIAGIAAALAGGCWIVAIAGLVSGPLLFLFARSYVELVRVIADTLLPR